MMRKWYSCKKIKKNVLCLGIAPVSIESLTRKIQKDSFLNDFNVAFQKVIRMVKET